MANIKSAKKRIRVSEQKRLRNRTVLSSVRSAIKRYERNVGQVDQNEAEALLHSAVRLLDKAVSKGVLHRNTVARKKSRLHRRLSASA